MYDSELKFEYDLVAFMTTKGWSDKVLKNYTEQQLIDNWANILYQNNSGIDQLNGCPLTSTEMQQIINQVNELHTPVALNGFINGKTVNIVRDNPNDKLHLGQMVSLSIYDRNQIASGSSVYQIAEQPQFPTAHPLASDRRGDLMLLINGMPVFHIELKKTGVDVSQAVYQIRKYYKEGIFSQGLFSLVQVFVAMNPEETVYFANPGNYDAFSPQFQFHWADFNNEPINDWKSVATHLLSIPMAHQMIGFYTVPDKLAGNLKVMRSYQYYAASAIADRVATCRWDEHDLFGGFIWHTTGSGKTMTSFKSAQLIADSGKADKVVFLMDRIELGTQTALEYRGFKTDLEDVQETEDTADLIGKLDSLDAQDRLIVTSIQKMSRIVPAHNNRHQINRINQKRLVIIIDECHRDVFGDMLSTIRATFTRAIFFGFTGTPIHEENKKMMLTTAAIFGNELHRYSIADGIRDENVLKFDPVMKEAYSDIVIRNEVALRRACATTEKEALEDEKKREVYMHYLHHVPMAGETLHDECIENYIPEEQYRRGDYRRAVVNDIIKYNTIYSMGRKYHAIFATSSIPEAFEYYVLLRTFDSSLKITCLVDPSIDNDGRGEIKEELLLKILEDYNAQYNTHFTMPKYASFKKDVALRLAHKDLYKGIENHPEQCLDILIVVNQMLTGYDSKWVNTLYLDKVLNNENLIQAFSRTNRLNGPEKPHGTICYYRRPHTMKANIERAIRLYSGDKPLGIMAEQLSMHIAAINAAYAQIQHLFQVSGVEDFSKLPEDKDIQGQFAKLFKELNRHLNAAKVQGFTWDKLEIATPEVKLLNNDSCVEDECCEMLLVIDETSYGALLQRYKEIYHVPKEKPTEEITFEIDPYIISINTGAIDTEYMNARFRKYMRTLTNYATDEEKTSALDELHRSFSTLTQDEQGFAELFLHDVQRGMVQIDEDKTLRDYITEYMTRAKNDRIHRFAEALDMNEELLREIMNNYMPGDIIPPGPFEQLMLSVDKQKAKSWMEEREGVAIQSFRVNMRIDRILRDFIEHGGFEV